MLQVRPDNDSSFKASFKKPYLMLPGRQPTPEDIAQGALEEGTNKDAQVLLAAVLLTPTGDMRLVCTQEHIEDGGAFECHAHELTQLP